MNFFCDYEFYEINWFHSLGCYWLSGGGTSAYMALHLRPESVETPLCPDLAKKDPASVPGYINEGLREVFIQLKHTINLLDLRPMTYLQGNS